MNGQSIEVIAETYDDGTKYEGAKSGENKEGRGTFFFTTGLIAY